MPPSFPRVLRLAAAAVSWRWQCACHVDLGRAGKAATLQMMSEDGTVQRSAAAVSGVVASGRSSVLHAASMIARVRVRLPLACAAALVVLAMATVAVAWLSRTDRSDTHVPLAATVNGLPITMTAYRRQLDFARAAYDGPGSPGTSPTGRTVVQLIADRAMQQAIGEVLIDNTARRYRVSVSEADVGAEVRQLTSDAGGPGSVQAEMKAVHMTDAELQSIARHTLLRDRIALILKDHAWLDEAFANAAIRYFADDLSEYGAAPTVELGQRAAPFVATDLRGRAISLADLYGKAVVLNFWSTWSGYSQSELPMLLQFARKHPQLYVIALDHAESVGTVRAFIQSQHLEGLTVWLDSAGQAYTSYEMTGIPATFFIDMHGILRSYNYGALADMNTLTDQAQHALRGLDNTYLNQSP